MQLAPGGCIERWILLVEWVEDAAHLELCGLRDAVHDEPMARGQLDVAEVGAVLVRRDGLAREVVDAADLRVGGQVDPPRTR